MAKERAPDTRTSRSRRVVNIPPPVVGVVIPLAQVIEEPFGRVVVALIELGLTVVAREGPAVLARKERASYGAC